MGIDKPKDVMFHFGNLLSFAMPSPSTRQASVCQVGLSKHTEPARGVYRAPVHFLHIIKFDYKMVIDFFIRMYNQPGGGDQSKFRFSVNVGQVAVLVR